MMRKPSFQHGFSLLEVLISALLFSVSLLGLLQYHHILLQAFHRHWQVRQAWSAAHQSLDAFIISGPLDSGVEKLEVGWQQTITTSVVDGQCRQMTSTVTTPQDKQAKLSRLLCTENNELEK